MGGMVCSRDVEDKSAVMQGNCKGCKYYSGWSCEYYLFHGIGHRRPCPGGDDCTVKVTAHLSPQEKAVLLSSVPYPSETPKQPKKRGRRKRVDLNTPEVIQLYNSGATDATIARTVGCSTSTVYEWRIKTRRPANGSAKCAGALAKITQHEKKMLELYYGGASDSKIAEAAGVSPATVWNWRQTMGLPTKYGQKEDESHEGK